MYGTLPSQATLAIEQTDVDGRKGRWWGGGGSAEEEQQEMRTHHRRELATFANHRFSRLQAPHPVRCLLRHTSNKKQTFLMGSICEFWWTRHVTDQTDLRPYDAAGAASMHFYTPGDTEERSLHSLAAGCAGSCVGTSVVGEMQKVSLLEAVIAVEQLVALKPKP